MDLMGDYKDLIVFQKAYVLAMDIFEETKNFPTEEKFSLTDQIRRSSRSVCTCLLEAYRKKKYPSHFESKVTDSDRENSETGGWLDFSVACKYIDPAVYHRFYFKYEEIGRLLNHMINNPLQY